MSLDLDSFPVAIAEIALLLLGATVAGWFLAKVIIKKRIDNLRELLEEKIRTRSTPDFNRHHSGLPDCNQRFQNRLPYHQSRSRAR